MPSRARTILLGGALLSILAIVVVALGFAPDAANFAAPRTQRIFYFHVPSAWVAYLAFAVTAAASAKHLYRPTGASDRVAAASAEVGLLFSGVALATGLLWARVEFTAYAPLEDPKVITLVVLILAYVAYFALRQGIEEEAKRARLAAVFGLLAFLGVPFSYFASRVSVHPDFTRPESSLAPELAAILVASVAAFTLLYASLTWHRYALESLKARLLDLDPEGR